MNKKIHWAVAIAYTLQGEQFACIEFVEAIDRDAAEASAQDALRDQIRSALAAGVVELDDDYDISTELEIVDTAVREIPDLPFSL